MTSQEPMAEADVRLLIQFLLERAAACHFNGRQEVELDEDEFVAVYTYGYVSMDHNRDYWFSSLKIKRVGRYTESQGKVIQANFGR